MNREEIEQLSERAVSQHSGKTETAFPPPLWPFTNTCHKEGGSGRCKQSVMLRWSQLLSFGPQLWMIWSPFVYILTKLHHLQQTEFAVTSKHWFDPGSKPTERLLQHNQDKTMWFWFKSSRLVPGDSQDKEACSSGSPEFYTELWVTGVAPCDQALYQPPVKIVSGQRGSVLPTETSYMPIQR